MEEKLLQVRIMQLVIETNFFLFYYKCSRH